MTNVNFLFCKWRPLVFVICLLLTQIYYFTRKTTKFPPENTAYDIKTTWKTPLIVDLQEPLVIKLEATFPPIVTTLKRLRTTPRFEKADVEQEDIDYSTAVPGPDMSQYMLSPQKLPLVEEVVLENQHLKDKKFVTESVIRNLFHYEDVDFKKYQLNATAAQNIHININVGKVHPPLCRNKTYSHFKNVKVSVIIPFHNELWAVLLRCLQSILKHSPYDLIHEIILIDDKSEKDNLRGPLVQLLHQVPKTRLLRTERREGLIRSRMAAARKARGNILVFMDAHVEVSAGWLEPLLEVIIKDKKAIAIPTVDHISPKTMTYNPVYYRTRGSFGWELDYVWKDVSDDIFYNRDVEPFKSGTMIGCAFAVDRESFFGFGGYDESMKIWGGENLEIAFRTWMCGGSLMVVPCSHIGHIYRAILPYNFTQATLLQNLQRVADVWMDGYKDIYFRTSGHEYIFNQEDTDALQLRHQLRKNLKCKDFKWYLDNVTPELFIPEEDALFFGQLRNLQSRFCLTVNESTQALQFDYCTLYDRNQIFTLNKANMLKYKSECLIPDESENNIQTVLCDGMKAIKWTFDYLSSSVSDFTVKLVGADTRKLYAQLKSLKTGSCLGKEGHLINSTIAMQPCDHTNPLQYWIFTHKLNKRR